MVVARVEAHGKLEHPPGQRGNCGSTGARAARPRGAGRRRSARRRGHRLPGDVPQPAGLARHPGRLHRRRARRSPGDFLLPGDPGDPVVCLHRGARRGRPGVLDRLAAARPRSAAGARAHGRRDRDAARIGDRAAQVPRRPVQPASGDHLLAARQPRPPRGPRAAAPLALAGLAPMLLLRWRMNLLALPDDEARALGVDTRKLRTLVVAAATLMTAAAVAVSGIIGWVGLLIPHAARLLVGPDFGRLLPLAMLLGAGFLLGVDTLCRTIATIEVPPGVLTALIGTPFFLWLFALARRSW